MKNKNSIIVLLLLMCGLLMACDEEESHRMNLHEYGHLDYALADNWMTSGGLMGYAVDVFYLYPTCWNPDSKEPKYCEIDNPSMRARGPLVYRSQGGIFADMANVFTPWYRQANSKKYGRFSAEEWCEVLADIPYRDVVDAFDYYLKHFNEGRPFILVGHSQGAYLLKLLLDDYMESHPEVMQRMIVAYALGCPFEDIYFDRNAHLSFATGERDINVVVSWSCERKVNEDFGCSQWENSPGALSINPISWRHDYLKVEADDDRYQGPNVIPEKYSVQVQYDPQRDCEVLVVGVPHDHLDSPVGRFRLPYADFGLFTQNIKANAEKRIHSFWQK